MNGIIGGIEGCVVVMYDKNLYIVLFLLIRFVCFFLFEIRERKWWLVLCFIYLLNEMLFFILMV